MYLYFWAGGYFSENNCFIDILKMILRPESANDSNSNSKNNINYDNTKDNFINKI